MPYISLGDKDRERFNVEEWLEFHPVDISIADLDEISERFGFDYTEWPEPFWGEIPFEQAGNPEAERATPRWQIQAAAWMALRQNAATVSWEDAGTVRIGRMRWRNENPNDESPGKDNEATLAKASPTPDASTTTPSSTSGRESPVES